MRRYVICKLVPLIVLWVGTVQAADLTPHPEAEAAFERGDFETAVELLRPAAEQGNARAQTGLGSAFCEMQNVDECVRWWRRAADQGYASAQYNLGIIYESTRMGSPDYKEALVWYRKAAEQGLAYAQHNLGNLYVQGYGVDQDSKAAASWFLKAAKQYHHKAQFALGLLHYHGDGVVEDLVRAQMWCKIAESHPSEDSIRYAQVCTTMADDMTQAEMDLAVMKARQCLQSKFMQCD